MHLLAGQTLGIGLVALAAVELLGLSPGRGPALALLVVACPALIIQRKLNRTNAQLTHAVRQVSKQQMLQLEMSLLEPL